MESELKRRLVSLDQLQTLLGFMKEHPELAKGLSRGRRGNLMTVKVWNQCAKKLNAIKDGAVKDGKGWSKYWCDWKYRVRRHALEIKVSQDTNKIPLEGITALSPIEETIMSIIGDSSIDGVVIKSDPLGNEDEDSNADVADVAHITDMTNNDSCGRKSKYLKRRQLAIEQQNDSDDVDEDSGSPPEQRARVEEEDAESGRKSKYSKRRRLAIEQQNDSNDVDEDSGSLVKGPYSSQQRARVKEEDAESEFNEDDNTSQFLRLEKMQLDNAKKIQESISQISLEICKLTDIMGEIRDVLVKRLNNVT